MSKDPNSYIQASVETLAETLSSKNHDYAPEGEFSNFEKAAEIAGTNAMIVMTAQAAIKMTRIQSLMDPRAGTYENESLKDSFLDLAGYALIAHAYLSANEPDRILIEPSDRPVGTIEPDPHWLVRDEG